VGGGFVENFGLLLGTAYLSAFAAFLYYVGHTHHMLRRVLPANRSMRPALVWLQVVPLFGTVWQFWVARAIADSLEMELHSVGRFSKAAPSRLLGLLKSIADAVTLASVAILIYMFARPGTTGDQAGAIMLWCAGLQLVSFVMWMVFWSQAAASSHAIGRYRAQALDMQSAVPRLAWCRGCGQLHIVGRFCMRCGAPRDYGL
jgi:hypothetical protein